MIAKAKPQKAHATYRPPSAAARWLSCHASVTVVPLYSSDESDASLKGDRAHQLLENGMIFGIQPDTDDPDMDLAVRGVLEYVRETKQRYGKTCRIYAERRYAIPETGEFGTADVTFVSDRVIEIGDYKNGFVPVDINMNAQMLTYLLGAIAEFGEREHYKITVYQPNYVHADGPYRTMDITPDDVAWFRSEVKAAMVGKEFAAGKHCKKSYCPHRASCATFTEWSKNEENQGWFTSEINSITDEELRQRLDYFDIMQGMRDEARKEAMRRIMQMDRRIEGYKLVKSRHDRSFAGDDAIQKVKELCIELGAEHSDLYSEKFESVAGIERFFKQRFKNFGNGAWKKAWDNNIQEHVRDFSGSLTLERAIDGRPAYSRGNEFGPITLAAIPTII